MLELGCGFADAVQAVELAGEKGEFRRGRAVRYDLLGGCFVSAGEVDVFRIVLGELENRGLANSTGAYK